MLTLSNLQPGTYFAKNNEPYQVVFRTHTKLGRGGAVLKCKAKNLKTGAVLNFTFKGNETVPVAEIECLKAQFLYGDEKNLYFMDSKTFEQFAIFKNIAGKLAEFLKEGTKVDVLYYEGQPINIAVPVKVELKVVYTEPAVRGDTAQGKVMKSAQLETGAQIQVPIFIKVGDVVRINTQTGQYVERV